MRKIALIPSFEPNQTLIKLVKELFKQHFVVVIVNDGSDERYTEIFNQVKEMAIVLNHEINKGKGEALKTGLSYIRKYFPENSSIVTLDADGQHSIKDTLRVCAHLDKYPNGLILGVRHFDQAVPLRSRFGNITTKFIFKLSTGLSVSDTQTGLRAFKANKIEFMLDVEGSRYEYEMNVLLKSAREKQDIIEIEIETIYENDNEGSHFDTLKDSLRIYKEIFKFIFTSLSSFLLDMGLYSLLLILSSGLGVLSIPVSNMIARIMSASYNFTMNRYYVFKHKDSIFKPAFKYILLASFIMIGNTFFLSALVYDLGLNKYIAKLITEFSFFTLSFLSQKLFIFNHQKGLSV